MNPRLLVTLQPDVVGSRPMGRRAVLRGAVGLGALAALSPVLVACTSSESDPGAGGLSPSGSRTNPGTSGASVGLHLIPQSLEVIPAEFSSPAGRRGKLLELGYDTWESMTYKQQTQRLRKRAILYVPHGYSQDERYNVLYLMHGGWSNEATTLGTPDAPSGFKNVLDNAIAAGLISPLIVVCPTYNNTSPQDSANFSLALTLNQNYHHELLNDLVPAVEKTYSTHAESTTPDGLAASRDHRGFGGFSMGAVATWRTFEHALDYFRYFLPMSCGTSLDMNTILAAGSKRQVSDFFVWVITGSDDFAHGYEEDRVALMRKTPSFVESDDEQSGNFAYRVKEGYAHDGRAASEYTYNGLRWFWAN